MGNKWDEMREAISEARAAFNAADAFATAMAEMLDGRLKRVDNTYCLKRLKHELRDFNSHTRQWGIK
jgi:hypothetical protein